LRFEDFNDRGFSVGDAKEVAAAVILNVGAEKLIYLKCGGSI
jgi:hypothetical protein